MSRTYEDSRHRPRNWWATREPKWWRRMMKHKKRRTAVKKSLRQDPEKALYPLDKKPWIYYW